MNRELYDNYVRILRSELVPALGCTEPIALAYASAKAVEILGSFPLKIDVECSGNIIKNVKGVKVPNSGGLKGVEAAVLLGALGGDASRKLEVLESVTEEHRVRTRKLLEDRFCACSLKEGVPNLYIEVHAYGENDCVSVRLEHNHTNITLIAKNNDILFTGGDTASSSQTVDKSLLNLRDILDFANQVDLDDVRDVLERQIEYNCAIAKEGLTNLWGVGVGKLLDQKAGGDIQTKAVAMAAAGSDARMSGCSLPVIIISGSGNQGMTSSLPVISYANSKDYSHEALLRALCISDLTAQDQKRYIGPLSAYCGVVCAAAGAGAAITYLDGGTVEQIEYTVVNTIATVGGMICDGAKPSCAAKIASALQAAFTARDLAMQDLHFESGEGLVMDTAENTIRALGHVGKEGMRQTDIEVLNLMIGKTELY